MGGVIGRTDWHFRYHGVGVTGFRMLINYHDYKVRKRTGTWDATVWGFLFFAVPFFSQTTLRAGPAGLPIVFKVGPAFQEFMMSWDHGPATLFPVTYTG